jgi:hypothetical protein
MDVSGLEMEDATSRYAGMWRRSTWDMIVAGHVDGRGEQEPAEKTMAQIFSNNQLNPST